MAGSPASSRRWKLCLAIHFGLALFRLVVIGLADLKVEEAYYWDYARHPSLSYFDHPPMVAWLITISCALLGDSSWAVRLPAVLLFLGSGYLLARLTREMFGDEAALWTTLLFQSLPAFTVHSLFILPDAPLLFFWIVGLCAGWRILRDEQPLWWWVVGVATGLGMTSKYPALLIPLAVFLAAFSSGRRHLALNPSMLGAALLANVLFAPVYLWNLQTDFASFRFQGSERMGQAVSLGEKLGSWLFQLGMLSPVAFFVLFVTLGWAWQRRDQPPFRYLLCSALPFLLLMVYVSTRRLVQINWPLPGYIASIVLMGAWLSSGDGHDVQRPRPRWLAWAILLPALLLSSLSWLPIVFPIAAANPIDDVNGWSRFGEEALRLRSAMAHPERTFLAGHGYQAAAELAYSTRLPHLVLSNNVLGERALSFTFWEKPSDFDGWDCIYANYAQPRKDGGWRERVELDPTRLKAYFRVVEGPIIVMVDRAGMPLREYRYFRCHDYRSAGYRP